MGKHGAGGRESAGSVLHIPGVFLFIFVFIYLHLLILLLIYTFQELADKYNETPLLLNGMAACKMLLGQFEDAEKYLLKALAANSTDVQTLQNLVVCSQVIIFFIYIFFIIYNNCSDVQTLQNLVVCSQAPC